MTAVMITQTNTSDLNNGEDKFYKNDNDDDNNDDDNDECGNDDGHDDGDDDDNDDGDDDNGDDGDDDDACDEGGEKKWCQDRGWNSKKQFQTRHNHLPFPTAADCYRASTHHACRFMFKTTNQSQMSDGHLHQRAQCPEVYLDFYELYSTLTLRFMPSLSLFSTVRKEQVIVCT